MNYLETIASDIVQAAAPELADRPLYVIDQPSDLAPYRTAAGYTGSYLPGAEAWLKRHGLWRGAGEIIVLDVADIADDLPPESKHRLDERLRQIIAHEIAHQLPVRPPLEILPTSLPEDMEDRLNRKVEDFHQKQVQPQQTRAAMPWDGDHGASFIRRCLHVHYRCDVAGITFPLGGLCAGVGYRLSNPEVYAEELADEPFRLRDATYKRILGTFPPKGFWQLWTDDIEHYAALRAEYDRPKNEEKRA